MPRLDTFRKLPYTAKLYNYRTATTEQNGVVNTYFYVRDVKCDLTQSLFSRITIMFGDDGRDIMPKARLEVLKDRNGDEVYPGGIWTLTGITPILTVYGTTEGFAGNAELTHETLAG